MMSLSTKENIFDILKILLIMLLGVFFMGLMAFKKVPIPATSIEMSLQSLSVSILVITLNKKAFWVVLLYLIMAIFGFPVLAEGIANPKWYTLPSAGYYFGFLISSYFLNKILTKFKPQSFLKTWLSFSINESLILFCGYFVLSFYFDPIQAWWVGVYPYIFGAILKITTAACLYRIVNIRQKILA